MKKSIITFFIITLVSIVSFTACQENDLEKNSVIDINDDIRNKFDTFLQREFIDKYNIKFEYKLPDIERNITQTVVPAKYENSIKMANIIKYLAFEPFDKIAQKNFIKKYFPKQLIMIGSGAFNNNGTVILGTAEGGRKISLYDINSLDITNKEVLFDRYFRTIYHEFAHIWHQTIAIPTLFREITPTTYKNDAWNEAWEAGESLKAGYITDYASNSVEEDFVELISHYMTLTTAQWEQKIIDAGTKGGPIITRKMTIVKDYLSRSWSLDIDKLRDEILSRGDKLDMQDFDNID
ncbi:zinc-binding metallopeptidase [Tenacibaculum mesophilum]|uniref:zinc-binding metallopeptidase n=1 Tax=Tenacibaculum mesophilum TaxID=104268 RepID=UPI00064A9A27|nr:putative zinc-binding metallopeptidase [Tenacibaculum mesophilum]BFF39310.1 putative zinc-binding metallopeptidase [Tenacibaculum mesophilum]